MDVQAMEKQLTASDRADRITVEELCAEIIEKRNQKYAIGAKPYPRSQPVSSDIGDCLRETVLGITNWRDRPEFSIELLQRFERGNKVEDLALAELQALGYRVRVDRRPFEMKDKQGRVVLRGRVDGFLEAGHRQEFPLECKSLNPNVFSRIDTQEDFDNYSFFRKYPRQLQSYLLAENLEEGFWHLDDCMGHWKLIPCRLDYERAERLLKQAEQAVEHVAKGTVPEFHADPAYCIKCWAFKRVCTPPFFNGEGMKMINDPEFADKLERRAELDMAATEYDKLDKEIKATLKEAMKPLDNWIIGDFLVSASEKQRRMKAQPAKEAHMTNYLAFDIERMAETAALEKSDADYEALFGGKVSS